MWKSFIVFCLVLAGCGGSLTRRGPLDPALSACISSDTVVLGGAHMDSIRGTPLYRKITTEGRWPRLDQFPADAGFDPVKDVHELLVASDGKNLLAAARGDFKGKRPSGLQGTAYKGYTVYVRDERTAIAFPDDRTVVGGPPAAVRAALDRWSRHADTVPRELAARARALPADAQIWAVASGWKGAGAETLREMGNAANADRMLRSVEGASLTIDLRAGAHAVATGDCRTEADAKNLSESLRGLAGIARIGIPKNRPEVARVFDSIQVRQEGSRVRVNIDIAEELAEQLLK